MDAMRMVSVIMALALILSLGYRSSTFLGRALNHAARGRYMKVIDQVAVGQDRQILIVEVNDKKYLVGSTPQNISLISEIEGELSDTAANNMETDMDSPAARTLKGYGKFGEVLMKEANRFRNGKDSEK